MNLLPFASSSTEETVHMLNKPQPSVTIGSRP